jgi:Sec-independent protein translocase protein TatA
MLFGVGCIGKIAGELGCSIRSFREDLNSGKDDDTKEESKNKKYKHNPSVRKTRSTFQT